MHSITSPSLKYCLFSLLLISILQEPAIAQAEKSREQIGVVLGKPVYRDQIKTGKDVRLSDEMHRLFSQPMGEKYFREHKKDIEPTQEEIDQAASYFDRKHMEDLKDEEPQLRRDLKAFQEKLKGKDLTEKQKTDLEIEITVLETKLSPPGRFFAKFVLDNWKYHKHLYDHFGGGRIQWQQVGLQAFDASRVFLESFEKKGDFKITDPKLREALYSYWKNESHLLTNKEEIREQFLEADWLPKSLKKSAAPYFPPKHQWQTRKPAEVGMDESKLQLAIDWAKSHETNRPKDLSDQVKTFGKLLGKMPAERGDVNGIILRHGYIVAEFGETTRVDPTYSVAKSYLSTLLGLTIDRGLIKNVNDPVRNYITDGGYDSPHNAKITWQHHVRQTSEWEGSLFGKSHAFLGSEEFGTAARKPRELQEPGSFYEYNDVRINRFALSLLRVWKRPLPEVLKAEIMDPIGASDSWVYHGYHNSTVEVDGKPMSSISGGTRWGGGLWISSRDHARFGYLMLRQGNWNGRQIISRLWIKEATTVGGPGNNDYGYLWWLNTQGKARPDTPSTSYAAVGAGQNVIWIDPEHDLVVVLRWYRGNDNEFFKRIIAAIR